MRAKILHRRHDPRRVAKQGHGLIADATAQGAVLADFFAAGGNVPGVDGEHGGERYEVGKELHSVC